MALKNEKYTKVDDLHLKHTADLPVEKVYNRAGVIALRAKHLAEVERCDVILAKMDQLGVE